MAAGIRPELIPIKKSVVDLSKGVILRTYYMRPDKLKRLINDLKTEPIKQYTNKIDKRNDVERIVTSGHGDTSAFSSFFPIEKAPEFTSIIQRSQIKDKVYETNPSGYNVVRCCQLLTSYVISIQDMYLIGFKNTVKDAMKNYEFVVNEQNKEIKPIIKDKKPKKGGDNIEFEYPTKYSNLEDDIHRSKIPDTYTKSTGIPIQTTIRTKLVKYNNSKKTGLELSRFLNFLHPTPNKVTNILTKLVDKNYRNNEYLIHNLILLPEMYENKTFISALMSSIIYDSFLLKSDIKNTDIDTNFDLYRYLLLNKIDSQKFTEIYKTYPNQTVDYTLQYMTGSKHIVELLNENVLTTEEKSTVILTLSNDILFKNLKDIRNFIAKENELEDVYLISCILDSLICRKDVNDEMCNTIISEVEKSRNIQIFTLQNMLDESVNNKIYGIEPTYNYLFVQSLIAKSLGNFYIPYDIAYKIGGLPYSTFVVNKIFNSIYIKFKKELDNFVYNNKVGGIEKQKELYMPLLTNEDLKDLDNQTFIRVDPLEVLYESPPKDTKYITITVPTDNIYKFQAFDGINYYIVFDLIKHITT